MAWERRGNNLYYYQKRRFASQVYSKYVGRGEIAVEIASMDLAARQERNEGNRKIRQQREEFGLFDNQVVQMSLLVKQTMEDFLTRFGFHKYRGEWRRRRNVDR